MTITSQDATNGRYNVGDKVNLLLTDSDAPAGSTLTFDLNAARLTFDSAATLTAAQAYNSSVTSLDNADFTMSAANGILTVTRHAADALQVFPLVFTVASDLGGGTTLTAMSNGAVGGAITLSANVTTFDPTTYSAVILSASADPDNNSQIYKLGNSPLFYTTQLDTAGNNRWSLATRGNATGGTLADVLAWMQAGSTGTVPERATTGTGYDSPFSAFGLDSTSIGATGAAMTFDNKFRQDRQYQLVAYRPVSASEPASFARVGSLLSNVYYMPSTTTLPQLTFSATGTLGMIPPVEGKGIYGQYYLNSANQLAIKVYKVKRLRVINVTNGANTSISGATVKFTDMQVTTTGNDGGEFLPLNYPTSSTAFYWGKGLDNAGTQRLESLSFTNSSNYYILGGTSFDLHTSATDVLTATGNSTGVSIAPRTVSSRTISTVDVKVQDRTALAPAKRYMQVKAVNAQTQAALAGINFDIQEVQNTAGDTITAGSMTPTDTAGLTQWNQIPEAMLGTQTRIVALTQTNTLAGYLPATSTYYAKWQLGSGFTAVGTDPANLTATTSGRLSVNADGQLLVANAIEPVYTIATQYPSVSSSTSQTTPPEDVIYQDPLGVGAVGVKLNLAGASGTFTGTTDPSGNLTVTATALATALGVPVSTFNTTQALTLSIDSAAAGYTNPVARTVNFSAASGFAILANTTADNATILDATSAHGLTIAAGNLVALLRYDELVVQGPSVDGETPKPVANATFQLQFYTKSGSVYTAIGSPTTVTSDASGAVLLPDIGTLSHAAIEPRNTYFAQLTQTAPVNGFATLPMQAMFSYTTQMGYSLVEVTQAGQTTAANFTGGFIDGEYYVGYQDTAIGSTAFNAKSLSLPFRRARITVSLLEASISLDSVPANLNFGRTQAKSIDQAMPLLSPSAPADQLASWGGVAAPATDVMTIGGTPEPAIGVQVTLDTATASWKLMLQSQLLTTDGETATLDGATLDLAARDTYLGTATTKGTRQAALSSSTPTTIPLTNAASQAATQIVQADAVAIGTYRMLWQTDAVTLNLPQNRGATDGAEYRTQMTWQLEATP
ncbi:WxL domain-containing protein [Lacticaseibacillus absianus]|uniref:WxL domain-containing protein n=1 Tax=Lacticaseibacillus absianus TaxID=2729623 RepID=UPI0015C81774|nr:WxL domain-containing protein [Lacticaseibacillus absianus]